MAVQQRRSERRDERAPAVRGDQEAMLNGRWRTRSVSCRTLTISGADMQVMINGKAEEIAGGTVLDH